MFAHLEDVLATFPLEIDKAEYRAQWWAGVAEFLEMWAADMPEEIFARLSAAHNSEDSAAALTPLLELRGLIAPPGSGLGQVGRMLSINAGEAILSVVGGVAAGHMTPRQAGDLFRTMGLTALGASLPAGQKVRERPMLSSHDDPDRGAMAAWETIAELPEHTDG